MRSKKWRKAWETPKRIGLLVDISRVLHDGFPCFHLQIVFVHVVVFQAAISARLPCSQVGGGGNNVPVGVEVRVNISMILYIFTKVCLYTPPSIYILISREKIDLRYSIHKHIDFYHLFLF